MSQSQQEGTLVKQRYRFFGRGARGQEIKELIEAPDDNAALSKIPEICRRRGITLDPLRDRLVRIVRKGRETEPVPITV